LINARAETLVEKPAFRSAFKYHRCLIPADGFFEWKVEANTKRKTPYFIHMQDSKPFAFAGLWETWNSPDGGQLRSCAIVTTEPNELMSELHNRMPVILHSIDYASWLDPAPIRTSELLGLLQPFSAGEMAAYPVSTLVNNPANDQAECVQPA
jgi:putative SOS response-associated peptidase YedK